MEAIDLDLAGLKLLKPRVFQDARGFFLESFQESRYLEIGIDCRFVQDNHSRSVANTLRGLHYQSTPGQAKLMRVARGRIFDVAVDVRPDSPTCGGWFGAELNDENHHQLFVPIGFAHGFCVLSEIADVIYKVSSPYDARTECTLRWDDPDIGIDWPVSRPILSDRDLNGESFADYRRRQRA
jgi:dTDP-4-dehydrorhamnose 3,5-epimerase